ncbi:hypothetical protein B0H14DRAFT_2581729 [Mycena olivaceomarginata]|nr:hypothetical protein B0H14DRAFT_2581729 [Mycena olivaceomarginata]
MSRKVQRSSKAASKAHAAGKRSAETDIFQAQFNEAKAAKKLTDQALKDTQAKLSDAKGTTRPKRGTGRPAAIAEPSLQATSSGRVISPRRTRTASVSGVAPPLVAGPSAVSSSVNVGNRGSVVPDALFPVVPDLLFPAVAPVAVDPMLSFGVDMGAFGNLANYLPYFPFDDAALLSLNAADPFFQSASSDLNDWDMHGINFFDPHDDNTGVGSAIADTHSTDPELPLLRPGY